MVGSVGNDAASALASSYASARARSTSNDAGDVSRSGTQGTQDSQSSGAAPGVSVSISSEGATATSNDDNANANDNANASANTPSTVSPVESFAYGALGLERPDQPQDNRNEFYTAGKWLAAGLTIGGIVSLFV